MGIRNKPGNINCFNRDKSGSIDTFRIIRRTGELKLFTGTWLSNVHNPTVGINCSERIVGNLSMCFQLHNLFLEIATQDRDAEMLMFDERLKDLNYFLEKSSKLINSKLRILQLLLQKDNVDTALEEAVDPANEQEAALDAGF